MKQKKLLLCLIGLCLFLGLSSCSDDDKSVFGDDFDIPVLTDANTIQFVVDATGEWKVLEINAGGGRVAIEWGDGRLQKIEKPDNAPIRYRYKLSQSFTVRVWAEELESFAVSGLLTSVSDIRLGHLPKMKRIDLNSIHATKELDLNSSCPNLEYMNIGNWDELETLHIDECVNLGMADIYTNPKLTSIKFGHCELLNSLYCAGNGISSLSLKGLPALRSVRITDTALLSALEVDDENVISALHIEGCAFQKLDFLDKLTSLTELYCSSNAIAELDVSNNKELQLLNCNNNQLTSLLIPEDNHLRSLDCHSNQLDKIQLDNVFNVLADISEYPQYYGRFVISYGDNPGEADCDKSILEKKRWQVN